MAILETVFTGLSTAARKSVIRGLIPELSKQGFSATGALKYLQQFGPVMRKQNFLAQWREITGAEKLAKTYRFIPKKYKLSGQLMAPTAEPMRRNFKYNFQVSGIDLKTGQPDIRWFSFLDDARYSPEQAEQYMRDFLDKEADNYEWMYEFQADTATTELYIVYRSQDVEWEKF